MGYIVKTIIAACILLVVSNGDAFAQSKVDTTNMVFIGSPDSKLGDLTKTIGVLVTESISDIDEDEWIPLPFGQGGGTAYIEIANRSGAEIQVVLVDDKPKTLDSSNTFKVDAGNGFVFCILKSNKLYRSEKINLLKGMKKVLVITE